MHELSEPGDLKSTGEAGMRRIEETPPPISQRKEIVNSLKFFKSRTTLKLVMHILVASRRSCLFAT